MKKIAILGTGAWGTALAQCLAYNKFEVELWGIDQNEVKAINEGNNFKYFPNIKFFAKVKASSNLTEVLKDANYVLLAIPSNFIDSVIDTIKPFLDETNPLIYINVAKGLDPNTNDIWSKTIRKNLKKYCKDVVSLVGPSFALDVITKKPTILNSVAAKKYENAVDVANMFDNDFLKVVPIYDEKGVQILAALKNLLAIGMGICESSSNSINTTAALLTEGINEIQLIAKTLGAKDSTILQYCGIGDIFLTCTSIQSRNFSFGKEIFNVGIYKALEKNKSTIEGYRMFPIVQQIMKENKLNLPLFNVLCKVLDNQVKPEDLVLKILGEIKI